MLGVDTPETTLSDVDPSQYNYEDTTEARDFAFNIGEDSTEYAEQQLSGKEVKVVMDPESDTRGYYDRRLAYIYVGGDDFGLSLLEEGYARVYDSTFTKEDQYDSAESEARSDNIGIWGYSGSQADEDTSTPTETETSTETEASDESGGGDGSGPITIANIQPEGDDETLTLQNPTDSDVDLSGYVVDFDDGQDYTIQDVALAPGESLTVHTGEGSSSESDVYAGYGTSVLANSGDTVTIRDSSGNTVAQESYGDGG